MLRYFRGPGSGAAPVLGADFSRKTLNGMAALGQKRSFVPDQPNVRFAPKADVRQHSLTGLGLVTL